MIENNTNTGLQPGDRKASGASEETTKPPDIKPEEVFCKIKKENLTRGNAQKIYEGAEHGVRERTCSQECYFKCQS